MVKLVVTLVVEELALLELVVAHDVVDLTATIVEAIATTAKRNHAPNPKETPKIVLEKR